MKTDPTIDTAPVRQWFEVLSSFGVDRSELLKLLDCDEAYLQERDYRIPARCHHAMLHIGARQTGIPGIILLAGAKTTAQSLGVVGHLMMNSKTLLVAGQQLVRFASLLSETGNWDIQQSGEVYDIRYTRNDRSGNLPEIEEASLAACIAVLRDLSAREVIPLDVCFSHADPGYSDVYADVFGTPVRFGEPRCLLRISAEDAHREVPLQQTYVHELLERHASELLDKLGDVNPTSSRVSQLVATYLAEGRVDIDWISEQMNMSRWTLTRHLKQEGSTFNDLVREIRSRLAQKYLNDKNMSVSEVGFLLGYSEPSAFQRAFRKWHRCTPSEYRLRH